MVYFFLSIHWWWFFSAADTLPPTLQSCPTDLSAITELGTSGTVVVWTEPIATDISGVANLVFQSHQSGNLFVVGETDVIYTFADNTGNSVDCEFTVTVTTGVYLSVPTTLFCHNVCQFLNLISSDCIYVVFDCKISCLVYCYKTKDITTSAIDFAANLVNSFILSSVKDICCLHRWAKSSCFHILPHRGYSTTNYCQLSYKHWNNCWAGK